MSLPTSASLWSEYGAWLLSRVGFDGRRYQRLMERLHSTPFEVLIERDENRAGDGIFLREEFYREEEIDLGVYDHRDVCYILEMLVALAIRIEEDYTGDPLEPHPEIIFWEMVQNLGLDRYDDRHYNDDDVDYILHRWLEREFSYNGEGSIFPVERPRRDQRRIEIWSQMNEYITQRP